MEDFTPAPEFVDLISRKVREMYLANETPILAYYLDVVYPQQGAAMGYEKPTIDSMTQAESRVMATEHLKGLPWNLEQAEKGSAIVFREPIDVAELIQNRERQLLKSELLVRAGVWYTMIRFAEKTGALAKENGEMPETPAVMKSQTLPRELEPMAIEHFEEIYSQMKQGGRYDIDAIDEQVGRSLMRRFGLEQYYEQLRDEIRYSAVMNQPPKIL